MQRGPPDVSQWKELPENQALPMSIARAKIDAKNKINFHLNRLGYREKMTE
jgi:hypothetical protein